MQIGNTFDQRTTARRLITFSAADFFLQSLGLSQYMFREEWR